MFADSCRLCHLSDVNDAQLVLSGPKYAKKISHIATGYLDRYTNNGWCLFVTAKMANAFEVRGPKCRYTRGGTKV